MLESSSSATAAELISFIFTVHYDISQITLAYFELTGRPARQSAGSPTSSDPVITGPNVSAAAAQIPSEEAASCEFCDPIAAPDDHRRLVTYRNCRKASFRIAERTLSDIIAGYGY